MVCLFYFILKKHINYGDNKHIDILTYGCAGANGEEEWLGGIGEGSSNVSFDEAKTF